ncbi:MAG: hypothetical protein CMF12_06025 [Idiomarina sp.]|uniref:EAL domain-containing protein n=1 Tax=Idiomarina sp. TaxID=1874361 RepID=UPI000C4FF239|nr:EAL domain-containing protein [Idiomarina sp.]MBT42064.1 hypothetical protein [Idiomarina sp.]
MSSLYHYQRIVALLSEKTMASELLLRSNGKMTLKEVLFNPKVLVNDIDKLTDAKVNHAIQLREEQGVSSIFVNYSPLQVESNGFLRALDKLDVLIEMGMIVVIEITEDSECNSPIQVTRNVRTARYKGYSIAIDDFGAGNSNYNSLYDLQPSIVKLDQKIIRQAALGGRAKDGFYQLIELLKNLEFKVIVEGIETYDELAVARKSRADFAQGFYFHKPSPVTDQTPKSDNGEDSGVVVDFNSASA